MKTIGFVGLGIMGKSMVRNLMKNGYSVHAYARNPHKVQDMVAEGVILHDRLKDAVSMADVVLTIVGGPADVEEIYCSDNGILAHAKSGAYLIDMTTSSPALAVRLHEEGKKRSLHVLDCPVTGGDVGARNATLSILCGAEEQDFNQVQDVLGCLGKIITLEGGPGAGQHTKAVNQIMVAGSVAGMCEGLAYAKANHLDLTKVLTAVADGAAASRSIDLYAKRIIDGDLMPGGYIKFLVKDLKLAKGGADEAGLKLPVLMEILNTYQQMMDEGKGDLGIQALTQFCIDKMEK
ncbi:MAG: NAD(P)-dependent oxidoreductase [Succinivibrio sp.]|nr:NAD(P)-dependent oxidoreductase [Succinivibrio sp.]